MRREEHHDAKLSGMRTTVTLDDDVAAAVEQLRRERSLGLSAAVNDLIRRSLTAEKPRHAFVQRTHDLGEGIDVSNVGDALETLDGPWAR